MVKIGSFWDQNDVTGQKFDEKVENFFFQNLGKNFLGVGFLFAFSLKTPFSMLKCPKSAILDVFPCFPIQNISKNIKITKMDIK